MHTISFYKSVEDTIHVVLVYLTKNTSLAYSNVKYQLVPLPPPHVCVIQHDMEQ